MENVQFQHKLGNGATVLFVLNKGIPLNNAYWDTVNTWNNYRELQKSDMPVSNLVFTINYNIPDKFLIDSVKPNVETIFHGYILDNTMKMFKQVPAADSKLPNWVTYNPEWQSFAFDTELIFNIKADTSLIPQCSYLTTSGSVPQISDHYQYANASKTPICSNPLITKNAIAPTVCRYNFTSITSVTSCSGYEPDEKIIYTHLLTHKTSGNSFEIKTNLYRSVDNSYKVNILNSSTDIIISKFNYNSISFPKDKSNLYEEISNQLNLILESYREDYDIETTYDYINSNMTSVSVNIKSKNSYISSLLSKDSYELQKDSLLQTV
jgi:hypothetical protein